MKRLLSILTLALTATCLANPAHAQAPTPPPVHLGVDLLSDTGGVDMSPYLHKLLPEIQKQWTAEETLSTTSQQQEALITVTVAPDGQILAMHIKSGPHSTFDKAAWGALLNTHFTPPPTGMRDQNLKLRIHFTLG